MSVWSNSSNLPTGTMIFDDGAVLHSDGVTYGALIQALKALGFAERRTEEALMLRNDACDALIVLPLVSLDEIVWTGHLIEARTLVVAKGIVAPETFDALLLNQRAASPPVPQVA